MICIKDGKSGNVAGVDDNNRLETFSITQTEFEYEKTNGNAFIVGSGVVTLTSDTESAIIYASSTASSPLVIEAIYFFFGPSTGGVGPLIRKDYFRPTGGTIITDETPAQTGNLLPTSPNTYQGNTYLGGEGKTITGSTPLELIMLPNTTWTQELGTTYVKGDSSAVSITPPPGNTNMQVSIIVIYYLNEGGR